MTETGRAKLGTGKCMHCGQAVYLVQPPNSDKLWLHEVGDLRKCPPTTNAEPISASIETGKPIEAESSPHAKCPTCDSSDRGTQFEVGGRRKWCTDSWHLPSSEMAGAAQSAEPPNPYAAPEPTVTTGTTEEMPDVIAEMRRIALHHYKLGGCLEEACGCPGSRLYLLVQELEKEYANVERAGASTGGSITYEQTTDPRTGELLLRTPEAGVERTPPTQQAIDMLEEIALETHGPTLRKLAEVRNLLLQAGSVPDAPQVEDRAEFLQAFSFSADTPFRNNTFLDERINDWWTVWKTARYRLIREAGRMSSSTEEGPN